MISVDKSVEHGGVPVNNSEENNVTRLEISVPVNNRENNDTLPEISVDKNNDTLPDIEETGEVSTATNTVNNKQIDPKSMKVKELKLQLRKLGLSTTGNKPILVDRLTSGLKKKQSVKITFFDDNVTTMTDTFCNTSKRKHSEEDSFDSFECNAKKLRRGVLAAQLDSDSTHSTLGESSIVTRIRNRMRKGRLGMYYL